MYRNIEYNKDIGIVGPVLTFEQLMRFCAVYNIFKKKRRGNYYMAIYSQ
jgi:hypothetical protein